MASVVRGSFAEAIRVGRRRWPGMMEQFAQDVSEEMVINIREHTPIDTMRLYNSIRPFPVRKIAPNVWTGGAHTNVQYASFVEDDTRPHRITARRAPMLVFWKNGRKIITKSVWHPGTSGYHMFARGSDDTEAMLDNMMEQRLHRFFNVMGL